MSQIALVVGVVGIISVLLRILVSLNNPGKVMNQRFVKYGDLTGKKLNEVIAACGSYTMITANPDNSNTCTWTAGWYSITILFDAQGKFVKIIQQKLQ